MLLHAVKWRHRVAVIVDNKTTSLSQGLLPLVGGQEGMVVDSEQLLNVVMEFTREVTLWSMFCNFCGW